MIVYKRIQQSVSLIMLLTMLFVVSFTSQAAPVIPVETKTVHTNTGLEELPVEANLNETTAMTAEMENFVKLATDTMEQGREIVEVKREEQEKQEEMLKLLAAIIFCEAGNQSYEGQVAVGAVIMNRVNSSKFPNTIEEVIYQKGQFTPAQNGWLDEVRISESYTDETLIAARDTLAGVNPIGNCMFFDQGGKGMQIGAHYFH